MTDKKSRWTEVDFRIEPTTKIGVRITRNRGDYNIQIVRDFGKDRPPGNFLPVTDPQEGEPGIEDVLYSLAKVAREIVAADKAKRQAKQEKKSGPKKESRKEGRGLSQLAREDAKRGGHEYVGPTARKKKRKEAR